MKYKIGETIYFSKFRSTTVLKGRVIQTLSIFGLNFYKIFCEKCYHCNNLDKVFWSPECNIISSELVE